MKATRIINTLLAFIAFPLLLTGLDQGEWILSLAMATCLVTCFMVEAELI